MSLVNRLASTTRGGAVELRRGGRPHHGISEPDGLLRLFGGWRRSSAVEAVPFGGGASPWWQCGASRDCASATMRAMILIPKSGGAPIGQPNRRLRRRSRRPSDETPNAPAAAASTLACTPPPKPKLEYEVTRNQYMEIEVAAHGFLLQRFTTQLTFMIILLRA
jgi:hypothetical protein